jgi:hypothetical protein
MKPKVRRRSSVRKRSGRLVSSVRTPSRTRWMRPAVGRAMAPTRVSSVVLPEPLGPVRRVIFPAGTCRLTSETAATGVPSPSM